MTDTSEPEGTDPQLEPRRWRGAPFVVIAGALLIVAVIAAMVWGSVEQQRDDDYYACIAGRGYWDIALGGDVADRQGELAAIDTACREQVYGE